MKKIKRLTSNQNGAVFYRLEDTNPEIITYVVSHPLSRKILLNLNVYGGEFLKALRSAVKDIVKSFPERHLIIDMDEKTMAVHSTLRGALNWNLQEIFYDVFGKSIYHSMDGCQRVKKENGDFTTMNVNYNKIIVPDKANMFFPDIIATGTSLRHEIDKIISNAKENGKTIERVFFFTIGTEKTLEVIDKIHNKLKENFSSYKETYLIFLEGIFTLATENVPVEVKQNGTDFLKRNAILTQEYIIDLYGNSSMEFALNVLFPCTIGDGFARGSDQKEHWNEQLEYWKKEMKLAEKGVTLYNEIKVRFPEEGFNYLNYLKKKKEAQWLGVPDKLIERI
ncbi:MAG: hypothetical protein GXO64_00890, partial [Candidatus Micrarchaeota archaeon]|nr:hypothetical protein [Candidatus Micrarchaeota archaeon]